MKKIVIALFVLGFTGISMAQETKVITIVESIVPMGIGRSRIIEHNSEVNHEDLTTDRENGKDSQQNKVKRRNAKIDELSETKLLNFYSGVGINFQNIASNDAIISSKITQMMQEGWTLAFITSGVESKGAGDDPNGIFITRLYFTKP